MEVHGIIRRCVGMSESSASEQAAAGARRIAFVGDSLIAQGDWQEWLPDAEVLNFSSDGATTADVLERLDQIVEATPAEIVLLIGTNDFGARRSVEHVVRGAENIVAELRRHLPTARLLVVSILPRRKAFAKNIRQANIHLRQFCATVNAHYLDLWPVMAVEKGKLNPEFSDDGLHLNQAGYAAWREALEPALVELRQCPPMTSTIPIVTADEYARPEV